MWDRVVFFRELQVQQRIRLVAEALPILERVSETERDQKIGPEQAAILRGQITTGVAKIASSGAVIPEMEATAHHEPRRLLAPQQKLLLARNPVDETGDRREPVSSPPDSHDGHYGLDDGFPDDANAHKAGRRSRRVTPRRAPQSPASEVKHSAGLTEAEEAMLRGLLEKQSRAPRAVDSEDEDEAN